MRHLGLIELLTRTAPFKQIVERAGERAGEQLIYGVSGSLKTLYLAGLAAEVKRPLMVITHEGEEGKKLAAELAGFLPAERIAFFPAREVLPYEVYAHSKELVAQRLAVLQQLQEDVISVLVVPVASFTHRLIPPWVFKEGCRQLALGQTVDREELLKYLINQGYERVDTVESPGQFSIRGGIFDIFPLPSSQPLRVEFFDDEIESIRVFDAETQRSLGPVEAITLTPARELLLPPEAWRRGRETLREEYEKQCKILIKKKQDKAAQKLLEKMTVYMEKLDQGIWHEGLEQFQPSFYPRQQVTPAAYFVTPPLVIIDEPSRVIQIAEQLAVERATTYTDLVAAGAVLPSQAQVYADQHEMVGMGSRYPIVQLASLPKKLPGSNPGHICGVTAKTMHPFLGKVPILVEEIKVWQKNHFTVVLMADQQQGVRSLKDALWTYGIEGATVDDLRGPLYPGQVLITSGTLQRGFELPQLKLVVVTEYEVFGRQVKARPRRAFREGGKLAAFIDLKVGDYVVHVAHGIGRYLGIESMEIGGVVKDYLHIQYAGEDRLYIPTEQAEAVQKYVGAEGHAPKLNRLGGTEWARVKGRVKQSIQDMAKELLELYAEREAEEGYAFGQDTVWQQEFEEAFPYVETPDQLKAIEDIKSDMERPKPMDRLLCGDVGYGKTEVALRGAFKAVMDGKQVAVLVPTTILAQQHYHTFRERFAQYPVSVAVLSRFRSVKEQAEVIKSLKTGAVDVVIGTHRLLSKDIVFKDLGLLIVDEEQRFGVAHKEKIKQLRKSVDVLTLTATPIPRTLHMSLVGMRDMSLIETPPDDRYPVQTYVVEHTPELIRDAVLREINRGGQVYYVHNRIADIDKVARFVQALLPDVRIAVAHGRMQEEQLEQVMLDFIEGNYDILLCTTIVENGLDIPNVNTLIVDEAENLGLSQLYQLRGRVGRSNRLAYAYFTYQKDRVLNEVAEKRLSAIREFTEFGSGFKIAMRDLEIRGSGNILGPEQHGHILSIGFDLYCRLLEEAINEMKGKKTEEIPSASVEINVNAYIPDSYIPDSGFKMNLYRRLMLAQFLEEVDEVLAECQDRFGPVPEVARNLLAVARIRVLARELQVQSIAEHQSEVRIVFNPQHRFKGNILLELAQAFPRKLSFSAAEGLSMRVQVGALKKQPQLLELLESIFKRLKELAGSQEALL
ncbi:MAG: transcription-repair coupling factor [Bacillota bacterium]